MQPAQTARAYESCAGWGYQWCSYCLTPTPPLAAPGAPAKPVLQPAAPAQELAQQQQQARAPTGGTQLAARSDVPLLSPTDLFAPILSDPFYGCGGRRGMSTYTRNYTSSSHTHPSHRTSLFNPEPVVGLLSGSLFGALVPSPYSSLAQNPAMQVLQVSARA